MLVDGAGQIIVDALTANRAFATIPSASSILDTSNYTVIAVSFGKDADGFRSHAHQIISPSSVSSIKVISYKPTNFSSYHTSATASALNFTYKLLPESPSPIHTRLEMESTVPVYSSGVPDIGHCLNSILHSTLSSVHHLVGCFPASGGTDFWMFSSSSNPTGTLIVSATFSSFFNANLIMDPSGFLTFADGYAAAQATLNTGSDFTKGAIRYCDASFPSRITIKIPLRNGDAGAMLLFGGLYHIGLWVLDIKETLKQGISPPFNFNALNNKRKYKLFAKKTFGKDLLYCEDYSSNSGMRNLFANGGSLFSDGALTITWYLNFV